MIRKGCIDDQILIMNIIKDTIADMESKDIHQWDNIYPGFEIINNDISKGHLYVYEDSGIIKGIVVLNEYQDKEYNSLEWKFKSGKQLVIHRLCVSPKYQGQGIARLLMVYAEQHGKELGYKSIRLDVFTDNHRACNFYEKLGYKSVGIVNFRKGKFYCLEKSY
ncbi:Acetyltransferase (GNAT) family protein [Anaerovirgula multivorans]|uniref:Acetyltransferase (GNAT) family protein n=1 Tax=Anaerovirgula multivorans TaxID=312168 RepID=A0A239IZ00_9FIRM|nr:GNAT family N-acetyltransferase [Anaerovirgula multivorans]SNS99006.1 Acetyltransferase (GNAT) family protein [Anaerovirgula multivorans]